MPNLLKQLRQLIDNQDDKKIIEFLKKEDPQHNLLNDLCKSGANALFYALTPPDGKQVSEDVILTLLSTTHIALQQRYGCELRDINQNPEIQALFTTHEETSTKLNRTNHDWRPVYAEPVVNNNPLITSITSLDEKLGDWVAKLPESIFEELKLKIAENDSINNIYNQALELALENGELNAFPFKSGTVIMDKDLRGADFSHSDLSKVIFIACDLRLSNLYDNNTVNPAALRSCFLDRYTTPKKPTDAFINADRILSHDNAWTHRFSNNETCLHMAVHNNSKHLSTLLNVPARSLDFLEKTNLQGNTVWHLCALENKTNAMKAIKGKCNNALFLKQNNAGDTALHIVAASTDRQSRAMLENLIDNPFYSKHILLIRNKQGLTPAQLTVEHQQYDKLGHMLVRNKKLSTESLSGINGQGESILDKLEKSQDSVAKNVLQVLKIKEFFPELSKEIDKHKAQHFILISHLNKVIDLLEQKIPYLNHNDATDAGSFVRELCADLKKTIEHDTHNLQNVFKSHIETIKPVQKEQILHYRGVLSLLNRLYDWLFPQSVATKPGSLFAPKTETSRLLNQLKKDVEDVQQIITPGSPAA